MGKYWFKVTNELINDKKVGPLPDNIWRRMVECFNMASILDPDNQGDGELPDLKTMVWFTRQPPETLTNELQELVKIGVLTEKPDNCYRVTNWAKRQGPVDAADRKRAQRQREQAENVTFLSRQRDPEVQSIHTTTTSNLNNKSSSSIKVTNMSQKRDVNVTELLAQLGINDFAQRKSGNAPAIVRDYTVSEILAEHDPNGSILANLQRWAAAKEAGAEITDRPALVWCKIVEGQAPPGGEGGNGSGFTAEEKALFER